MRWRRSHGEAASLLRGATASVRARVLAGAVAGTLAALAGGCSSSISTPLPDLGRSVSDTMSQQQQRAAVDDLNRRGHTHEQEAERQIEQSR